MILAYTRDAVSGNREPGTGDKFRMWNLFAMSAGETPKKISTSEVCFLCKEKVSSEEKIKVFGKSTLDPCVQRKSICPFTSGAICRSKF